MRDSARKQLAGHNRVFVFSRTRRMKWVYTSTLVPPDIMVARFGDWYDPTLTEGDPRSQHGHLINPTLRRGSSSGNQGDQA